MSGEYCGQLPLSHCPLTPYMLILTPVVHWVIMLRREQGVKGRKVLLEQSKQRTQLYYFLHSFNHAGTTPALLQLPLAPVYTLADYASMHSLLSFVPLFHAGCHLVAFQHASLFLKDGSFSLFCQ